MSADKDACDRLIDSLEDASQQCDKAENSLSELVRALAQLMEQAEAEEVHLPIDVHSIEKTGAFYRNKYAGIKCGQFVQVRPVSKNPDKKTYVGIYLGDFGSEIVERYNKDEKKLKLIVATNPAMFIPELRRIVFGYESWWGPINSEKDLKQVTDDDIQNIWYVKLLKEMSEAEDG